VAVHGLEEAAGAEFLAAVEFLDLGSLGQRWVQQMNEVQRSYWVRLFEDIRLTGDRLLSGEPGQALLDHAGRRLEGIAGALGQKHEADMEFISGALRLHRGFIEALSLSQTGKRGTVAGGEAG
jgi:hypothetical protein